MDVPPVKRMAKPIEPASPFTHVAPPSCMATNLRSTTRGSLEMGWVGQGGRLRNFWATKTVKQNWSHRHKYDQPVNEWRVVTLNPGVHFAWNRERYWRRLGIQNVCAICVPHGCNLHMARVLCQIYQLPSTLLNLKSSESLPSKLRKQFCAPEENTVPAEHQHGGPTTLELVEEGDHHRQVLLGGLVRPEVEGVGWGGEGHHDGEAFVQRPATTGASLCGVPKWFYRGGGVWFSTWQEGQEGIVC